MPRQLRSRGPAQGYRAKRRQILAKVHEANIPLPTSVRNKSIITRYHNLLFGHVVKVDGRKQRKSGLLSREANIQKFKPADAAIIKKTLTFHGKTINKGLPRLGNTLITQPGRVRVLKNTIRIRRKYEIRYLPRVDNKIFVTNSARAFQKAIKQRPKGTDIRIRVGSHVLPGSYADVQGARTEYDRLRELYKTEIDAGEIDISIEFESFSEQDEN
jgi:hypothetical protein